MYGSFTEIGTAVGGPWGTVVGAAGDIGMSLLSLFGLREAPYNDFREKVEPLLKAQAVNTGKPVFCLWYGEVIGISPDGKMISLGGISPASEGNASLAAEEAERIVRNTVEQARETAYFYKDGRMVEIAPSESKGIGLGGIGPLLLIGGLFLYKKIF